MNGTARVYIFTLFEFRLLASNSRQIFVVQRVGYTLQDSGGVTWLFFIGWFWYPRLCGSR
jgi:hypothetical protein